jgi:hypothetical protein
MVPVGMFLKPINTHRNVLSQMCQGVFLDSRSIPPPRKKNAFLVGRVTDCSLLDIPATQCNYFSIKSTHPDGLRMQLSEYRNSLEPSYDDFDDIIVRLIRPQVSDEIFRHFDACRFKVKALYYLYKRVQDLDKQYHKYLSLALLEKNLDNLHMIEQGVHYFYFPFFEAMEFENILSQGKAALDCFSLAIGSMYHHDNVPTSITALCNDLQTIKQNQKAKALINIIKEYERLWGLVVKPSGNEKWSIRDLINHRERVDIFFTIRLDRKTGRHLLSDGALVNNKHKGLPRFRNYLVSEVSGKIWFMVLGIIENCFKIQFSQK